MRNFKRYLKDTRGNFSVMLGVGMTALAVGTGAAVDMANMVKAKNELQSQLDIATLAAAGTPISSQQELDYSTLVHDIMVSNGYSKENEKPQAVKNGAFLDAKVQMDYEGLFTDLFGGKTYQVSVLAQSTLPTIGPMELVLALDNTLSMSQNGKMGALKIGAGKIVDAVEKSNSGTLVGIVPFARYINVGDESGSWLDKPTEYDTERTWQQATHTCDSYSYEDKTETQDGVAYTYEEEICNGRTTTYEQQSTTIESRYIGCVGTSDRPNHLSPVSANNRVEGLLTKQPQEATGLPWDTDSWCPLPIRPLDDDYYEIGRHINEMYPTDVTYIPLGLVWSERLLDRTVAFTQDAKDEDKQQVLVLMSDGKNTAEIRDDQYYEDHLFAPPYIFYDYNDHNINVDSANEDTKLLCDRMKDKGIVIYTIIFQVADENAKTLLTDCASTPGHAYEAGNNDALIESFEKIGTSLSSNVRLTR